MLEAGFYNMDCMEALKDYPDGYFDLAVVDPPYGDARGDRGGYSRFTPGGWFSRYKKDVEPIRGTVRPIQAARAARGNGREPKDDGDYPRWSRDDRGWHGRPGDRPSEMDRQAGGTWAGRYGKKIIGWDTAPGEDYFRELFRVSKNQIIWGGNYFSLPPTRCFLIWRKLSITESFSMAMCEYAWTSFNDNAKLFECAPQGTAKEIRFHPTQKPVKLYSWILSRYAKKGDKILDTHVGSASSLIACYRAGLEYTGFEIDPDYYRAAAERLEREKNQISMFELLGDGG